MSVIFQTLKKLQHQPAEQEGLQPRKGRIRKSSAMGLLATPLGMGLFLGAIFAGGFALLYGLDGFSSPHRQVQERVVQASVVNHPVQPPDPVQKPPRTETYQAPQEMVVDEIPPLPAIEAAALDASIPDLSPNALPPDNLSSDNLIQEHPVKDTPPNGAAAYTPAATIQTMPSKAAVIEEYVAPKPATLHTPDLEQQRHLANLEKFQKTAKQRVAVTQMVTQLENAIGRMDEPEVKQLLQRLAVAKGDENPYLLNLKAYWSIKQENYGEAEALLLKILQSDQDHLGAGVNLAIVEIKTNRKAMGIKRLRRLEELYPENTVISGMLRKLS